VCEQATTSVCTVSHYAQTMHYDMIILRYTVTVQNELHTDTSRHITTTITPQRRCRTMTTITPQRRCRTTTTITPQRWRRTTTTITPQRRRRTTTTITPQRRRRTLTVCFKTSFVSDEVQSWLAMKTSFVSDEVQSWLAMKRRQHTSTSGGVGQRVVSTWYHHWTVLAPHLLLLAAEDATNRRLEASTLLLGSRFVKGILTWVGAALRARSAVWALASGPAISSTIIFIKTTHETVSSTVNVVKHKSFYLV